MFDDLLISSFFFSRKCSFLEKKEVFLFPLTNNFNKLFLLMQTIQICQNFYLIMRVCSSQYEKFQFKVVQCPYPTPCKSLQYGGKKPSLAFLASIYFNPGTFEISQIRCQKIKLGILYVLVTGLLTVACFYFSPITLLLLPNCCAAKRYLPTLSQ